MKKYDIDTYHKLGEGAAFYLEESFISINYALSGDYSTIIFTQLIKDIDVTNFDKEILQKSSVPSETLDLLQKEIGDVLSNETVTKLQHALQTAKTLARSSSHKFNKNHQVESIYIIGHITNFAFFIEVLINRHLLYLNHSKIIDDFSYKQISSARILDRIIYIFKNQVIENNINLTEIKSLFQLRNKAVHFTPENSKNLKIKISQLIKTWDQSRKVIMALERIEKFNEHKFSELILNYKSDFQKLWT